MPTPSPDKETEFKKKSLAENLVFATTPDEDIEELARCAKNIAFEQGTKINDGIAKDVLIIQSGVVASLRKDHAEAKSVLSVLFGPGDLSGLQVEFEKTNPDEPRTDTTNRWCISNVTAIAIPTADLLRVSRRCPELAHELMASLASQGVKTSKLLAQALGRPLELRLAWFFSTIGETLSSEDWRPDIPIGKIPQSSVAELLGVSREHVNRTLTMWEKSGLIFQNKWNEISIQNRKRLSAFANDNSADSQKDRDNEWLWEIDSYLDLGLNQTAFHLSMEGVKRAARDQRFKHRAILATARSGAPAEALALYDKLKLKHDDKDEEVGCLKPRILRDLAFATKDDKKRHELLVDSAEEYAKVFDKCRSYYSGINAAYGFSLLKDDDRARGLAGIVEDITTAMLAERDEDEETYWLKSTIAECKLLQKNVASAASQFNLACGANDITSGKKATTRRQLSRIAPYVGIDEAWIDEAVPQPRTMFFSGPLATNDPEETDQLIKEILKNLDRFLKKHKIERAYGALASGCDIAIAEKLLKAGINLEIYLPHDPKTFLKSSVVPFGKNWQPRFIECMKAASFIDWNRRTRVPSRASFELGAIIAMGKSIRHADELQSDPLGFFAVPSSSTEENSLSHANLRVWEASDYRFYETKGDWPEKPPTCDVERSKLYFALVCSPPTPAASFKKLIDIDSADEVIEGPNSTTVLFSNQEDAYKAAIKVAESQTTAYQIWLDAGAFQSGEKPQTPQSATDNLITVACQPSTSDAEIYASEAFVYCASILMPKNYHFEYIGFANSQEKLEPCPLFLVK